MKRWTLILLVVLSALVGCKAKTHTHEDEETEPFAITRWTDTHELFVEFPPPEPGKPLGFHAHVTRLEGFHAVTEGSFVVRFVASGKPAAEIKADAIKRAGVFTPHGTAPPAGSYQLEMEYRLGAGTTRFDCGAVEVREPPVPAPEPSGGSSITFLKEQQWTIPFGTAWAAEHDIAREIELPATIEPAGTDRLTIGAPVSGRFFHDPKRSLAEGRHIDKGEVIGRVAPDVAGDDYTRLRFAVDDAKLELEQNERERKRIGPLVDKGLLPEKRRIELDNEREQISAKLSSARRRIGRVTTSGGAGGVPIRSALEGTVWQVLVPNGESVESGAPLVRIAGSRDLWLRARFVARPEAEVVGAEPIAVRLPGGERVSLPGKATRFLSARPVVDPASQLATWIAAVNGEKAAESLRPGVSAVLIARVGKPHRALGVPRSAVVEIATRKFVFVQLDGEHFDQRRVEVGASDGDLVEILSGVKKGERIVTLGGFDVHLAAVMGTVVSHRH